jgi:glycosyltransferase involved in cell wall biosynthesis
MGMRIVAPQPHRDSAVDPLDHVNPARPQVCILTETYFPVIGGGETQARVLAEGLAARGWGVMVLTRRTDPSLPPTEMQGHVAVHRLRPVGSHHLKKWGLLLTASWALLRLRRQYDVTIVSGFRLLGIPAAMARRLFRKPSILKADSLGEMSGNYFAAGLAKLRMSPSSAPFRAFLALRNRLLRSADCHVAISFERIPNSVDTERFAPPENPSAKNALRERLDLPVDVPIVVYTGRLVSYKGLPLLLRVWRDIHEDRPDPILVLVGAGGLDIHSCEEELTAFVRRHDLTRAVRFTGDVTNVHEYLQAADLFVLPTENEAFGISLIEAMATGVPVISTRVGGIPDVLRHEENGLLVDAGDELQLRDAVMRLLRDSALAERIAAAARHDAVNQYSTEKIVERYANLVDRMLEKTRRPEHPQRTPDRDGFAP